jgi:hypothetical protein
MKIYKIKWKMVTPQGQALVSQYGPLGGEKVRLYSELPEKYWEEVERVDIAPWQQYQTLCQRANNDDPAIKDVGLFVANNPSDLKWELTK